MKKGSIKRKKALSRLLVFLIVVTMLVGVGGAALAVGTIEVTKKETDTNDQQLSNKRTYEIVERNDSVTMGDTVASGHFLYAKVNVAAAKAATNGIDYPIVHGNGQTKVGTANIKIVSESDGNDYIVFTIINWSPTSKAWDVIAKTSADGLSSPPQKDLDHKYKDTNTATIPMPTTIASDGTIAVFFHGQGIETVEYREVAVDFTFQITDENDDPVSITKDNITFRSSDGFIIENGGAIIGDGSQGTFTLKNGITATISGLPAGKYKIKEVQNNAYLTDFTVEPEEWDAPSTVGGNVVASITVTENGVSTTVFTNKSEKYSLKITKEVTNGGKDDLYFDVKVTFTGHDLMPGVPSENTVNNITCDNTEFITDDNGATWIGKLKHGETVTFSNISVGTTYNVEEINVPIGYELKTASSYQTGTMAADNYAVVVNLENEYSPTAPLDLYMAKTVTGTSVPGSWSFNFALYNSDSSGSQNGAAIKTVTVTNSDPFKIDTLGFKTPGTYYYLIRETSTNANGWTVDTKQYHIKVDVQAVEPSNLAVEYSVRAGSSGAWGEYAAYDEASAEVDPPFKFENKFSPASANLSLSGRKTIEGAGAPSETFRFTVTDITDQSSPKYGEIVATGSRSGAGTFNFTPINFTSAGTYAFLVKEDTPGAGWTSVNEYTIYARVTVNSRGQLEATAYTDAAFRTTVSSTYLTFLNRFAALPTDLELKATKTLSGSATYPSWEFEFALYASDSGASTGGAELGRKTISDTYSPSMCTFESSEYFKAPGEYYFLMRETSLSENGWTVDARMYHIRVTVKADNGSLAVSQIQYRSRNGTSGVFSGWNNYVDSIAFNNNYEAGVAGVTLAGVKSATEGAPIKNFEFIVNNTDGNYDGAVAKAYVTGSGEFVFSPQLTFTENGTYEFEVSETEPGDGWVAKTAPYTVIVKVDGAPSSPIAKAYIIGEGGSENLLSATDLAFENEHTQTVQNQFSLELKKSISEIEDGETGDIDSGPFDSTSVVKRGDKITYTITVTNNGHIDGHVEEIVDRIPVGLEFDPDDNPDWIYDSAARCAYTTARNNVLLHPADEDSGIPAGSTEVTIVLTVSQNVAGGITLKNVAEIFRHSDRNHNWIRDWNSTPDNKISTEDDQDDADVKVEPDPQKPGWEEPYIPPEGDDDDDDDDDDRTVVTGSDDDSDADTDGDDDDDRGYQPGGNDRTVPPRATVEGNTLEEGDEEGVWIEIGPDGVALGEWRYDPDLGEWVFFDWDVPLGTMPATNGAIPVHNLLVFGFLLIGCGLLLAKRFEYEPKHLKKE